MVQIEIKTEMLQNNVAKQPNTSRKLKRNVSRCYSIIKQNNGGTVSPCFYWPENAIDWPESA